MKRGSPNPVPDEGLRCLAPFVPRGVLGHGSTGRPRSRSRIDRSPQSGHGYYPVATSTLKRGCSRRGSQAGSRRSHQADQSEVIHVRSRLEEMDGDVMLSDAQLEV